MCEGERDTREKEEPVLETWRGFEACSIRTSIQKMQKISNKAKENCYIWKINVTKLKLKASACHEQSVC